MIYSLLLLDFSVITCIVQYIFLQCSILWWSESAGCQGEVREETDCSQLETLLSSADCLEVGSGGSGAPCYCTELTSSPLQSPYNIELVDLNWQTARRKNIIQIKMDQLLLNFYINNYFLLGRIKLNARKLWENCLCNVF